LHRFYFILFFYVNNALTTQHRPQSSIRIFVLFKCKFINHLYDILYTKNVCIFTYVELNSIIVANKEE